MHIVISRIIIYLMTFHLCLHATYSLCVASVASHMAVPFTIILFFFCRIFRFRHRRHRQLKLVGVEKFSL